MYITKNINFSFLANQNSDDDLTPRVVRVIQEKNRDGSTKNVLVLKFFCRVDRDLLSKSNCQKIDLRLSKNDLSFYRSKAKLTQTKVAVAKIKENRREENEKSDDGPVKNILKNRQEKRKDRKKRRKNRKEERRSKSRSRNRLKRGTESLFSRDSKDSGDRASRRRGDFKNRDRKSKREKRDNLGFVGKTTQRRGRRSLVKSSMKSKVLLEPKNLLLTATASPKFRLLKNQDIYGEAKFLSSINLGGAFIGKNRRQQRLSTRKNKGVANSSTKQKLLAPDTILQINKAKHRNLSQYRSFYRSSQSTMRTFQKQYSNMVESGIDPLSFFEDSFGKVSFNQHRTGNRGKVSSNTKRRKILPVFREIQRQISNLSSTRYNFKKIKNPSRYKVLECFGRISLDDLQDLGNNAYILFIAKDRMGINMQAQSFSFRIDNVLRQIVRQSTGVDCSVTRTPMGVCKLNVSNVTSQHPADVNIEVKKIKRQDNFIETDYESVLDGHTIPIKASLSVVDGSINTKRRTPVNFNASDNLFFRTTINYRGKKYFNCNSASIKGLKGSKKNDNIPNLNIVAKIDEQQRGMFVEVTGISGNVSAVNLKKYRYTGSSKGKLLDTFDLDRNKNQFKFVDAEDADRSAAKSVRFFDTDVFDNRTYMYVVECIMKNGEKKMATDYFIEKYEERTGTVLISDVNVIAPSFIPDASESTNNDKEVTRSVQINFKIRKLETEVDKVISNMFGNLIDIFEDELKKIKDVQGLVYSIEIQRIEEKTGQTSTVGKVTADKSGNCVFVDDDAPAFSNITYKLIPRVRPATETIDAISAQTPFLAKKTMKRPINFVSSAARIKARNRNDQVFTSKKDKYNDRQLFKRGRIRTPKDILAQNAEDLFADSSTGDIMYLSVGGLSDVRVFDNITIDEGSVSEIKHTSEVGNNGNNRMVKKYFELEFETNNDFLVDFYVIFIKEGREIYLDGAMHSEDVFRNVKEYRYLVEHFGSAGVVEYYVVPILKTGKILAPKLITAQLIE